jgi:hypothetical protein
MLLPMRPDEPGDYRAVQADLFSEAGAWAFDTWHEHNRRYFAGALAYDWIVWGLTPHGHSLGFTAPHGQGRITLHPSLVAPKGETVWSMRRRHCNTTLAADVLLHEMIHQRLWQRDGAMKVKGDSSHNNAAWCAEVVRLSPLVLGTVVQAAPIWPIRRQGTVSRQARPGYLARAQLARWPYSLRPQGYYGTGEHLALR